MALDYPTATTLEIVAALRVRDVSAVELAQAAIARIKALDGALNAVVVRDFDNAIAAARAADEQLAGGVTGPLLGVPMTVKESWDLTGYPTTWGDECLKTTHLSVWRERLDAARRRYDLFDAEGSLADLVLLVEGPEGGDEVQAMKAGLLESADLVVVNKGDRPGADRAVERLRSGLALGADAPEVLLTSATEGSGVTELLRALDAAALRRGRGGRVRRVVAHLAAAVEARAAERLRAAEADGRLEALARGITDGLRPLSGAVDELLQG